MKFAVIIVAYAGDKTLSRALASILAQDIGREELEICVVENRSHPIAKREYESQIDSWLTPSTNLGASGGRNFAAANTSSEILCFIDDDGVADESFVSSMKQLLLRHPDAFAARGRVLPIKHPVINTLQSDYDLGDEVRECLYGLEGATCIRRDIYMACGGYNEELFHHEGIDFLERVLAAQEKPVCLYNPQSVLYHDFSLGLYGLWKKIARMNYAQKNKPEPSSRLQVLEKRIREMHPPQRLPLGKRIYRLPVRLLFRICKKVHLLIFCRGE